MTDPQTTPEQALATVAAELSASASEALLDPTGTPLTLRGAIKSVLTKVTLPLSLQDRPHTPAQTDDLYGHVLSLRAEQLITQALVTDLAAALGRDVTALRANAIASLQSGASNA